jgi:RimJ/RimL family protein N-acetyltransferase
MTGTTIHIPTLQTDRLILRAPRMDDFRAYAAFRADTDRMRFMGGPSNEADSFGILSSVIGHWQLRGYGRFLVADRVTDAPLGIVGPYFPPDWPEREIAWAMFAAGEGRGLAFEAALAVRAFAYDTLGWTTAISMIADRNDRSIALARRMGCVREPDYQHPEFGQMQVWRHPGPGAR